MLVALSRYAVSSSHKVTVGTRRFCPYIGHSYIAELRSEVQVSEVYLAISKNLSQCRHFKEQFKDFPTSFPAGKA